MIDWVATQNKFHLTQKTAKAKDRIVVKCDQCGKSMDRVYASYKQTLKSRGYFWCFDCATKTKQFKEQCSQRAKKLWNNSQYKHKNLKAVRSEEYKKKQSQISAERWEDPQYREKMLTEDKRELRKKCSSRAAKKLWEDSNYAAIIGEHTSKRMKEKWKNPEYREKMYQMQSENTKRMWEQHREKLMESFNSQDFINKMCVVNNEINNRLEVKEHRSRTGIEMWENPEYREKMRQIYETPEYKQKLSDNTKQLWNDPEYREFYQSEEFVSKCRESSIKLWNDPEYQKKMNDILQSHAQRFIEKSTKIHNDKYDYSKVEYNGCEKLVLIICPIHGEFQQTPKLHIQGCGCQKCAYTLSRPQLEIYNWAREDLGFNDAILNDRNAINPLELDIYVPSKNVGIEFHGLYWHSFNNIETIEEKHRHYDKCNICVDNNIQLIQVFENEWRDKQDIVKSIIANKLGKSESIYARKCTVKLLLRHEHKQFMDVNHLQGGKGCTVAYGLFYCDELVSCMSFNKHKKFGWEITRFANKLGVSVVGGASKLFKYFIVCYNPERILSYADRRFSEGGLYRQLGFRLDGVTKPNYFYTDGLFVFSRQQFMKHKLKKRLRVFDEGLTEVENMFNNGYRRLWDAGHWRFIWD